ncbi:MAG: hypothetical protein K0V04_38105 [Deltaproteobacteria bacterium]|nr:hypothetical protein [Deltaproteobacteria bacterium]
MSRRSIVVIDDFYEDPEEIRRHALSLEYHRGERVTYPGGEARSPRDWSAARTRLKAHVDERVDAPCPKTPPFPQGLFRLALAADEATRIDGVHQDVQRWSGVVYLSRPEDCEGGVAFMRHRETGLTASSRDFELSTFGHLAGRPQREIEDEMLRYLADMRHWEEFQRIGMVYNRAVLLMGQCFHMSMGVFGADKQGGRLTQHFEFYTERDGQVLG